MVDSMAVILCMWCASAAAGAFIFVVVKPRVNNIRESGRRECERLFELMDQLAVRKTSLQRLALLIMEEQQAYSKLQGAASLEALERRCTDYLNAGEALLALEVEAGALEGEVELVEKRYGRLFFLCFLRSTTRTALSMCQQARDMKQRLFADAAVKKSQKSAG